MEATTRRAGAAASVLSLLLAAGCGSSPRRATPPAASATPAQRLAALQEGVSSVRAGDPLVARLDAALDRLQPVCTESRTRLAAEAAASWQSLRENGLHDTIASVLDGTRGSLPASSPPTDCGEVMAAYLLGREGS